MKIVCFYYVLDSSTYLALVSLITPIKEISGGVGFIMQPVLIDTERWRELQLVEKELDWADIEMDTKRDVPKGPCTKKEMSILREQMSLDEWNGFVDCLNIVRKTIESGVNNAKAKAAKEAKLPPLDVNYIFRSLRRAFPEYTCD